MVFFLRDSFYTCGTRGEQDEEAMRIAVCRISTIMCCMSPHYQWIELVAAWQCMELWKLLCTLKGCKMSTREQEILIKYYWTSNL